MCFCGLVNVTHVHALGTEMKLLGTANLIIKSSGVKVHTQVWANEDSVKLFAEEMWLMPTAFDLNRAPNWLRKLLDIDED